MDSEVTSLITMLSDLDYLGSIHECRVLSVLVGTSTQLSAKEISEQTSLPDSKVYPALNTLEDQGLVIKARSKRPHTYFFNDPQALQSYLEDRLEEEFSNRRALLDQVHKQILRLWQPSPGSNWDRQEEKIAYIYHGDEIKRELVSLVKSAEQELTILLASGSPEYVDTLATVLPAVLDNGIDVFLSIPKTPPFMEAFEPLSSHSQLRLKFSIWQGNSYIIRDDLTMLNIMHRDGEEVGLVTNDELLVKNIRTCWGDEQCCQSLDQRLDQYIVDLEVTT